MSSARGCSTARSSGQPAYGSTLESVDLSAAQALDDVVVLREGDRSSDSRPRSSYRATPGPGGRRPRPPRGRRPRPTPFSNESVYDHLREHADPREQGRHGREAARSRRRSRGRRPGPGRESYRVAYIQHAPMEPRAAVAEWKGDAPDGLGGLRRALQGAEGPGRGVRHSLPSRFRVDHPRHGRRVWREAHRRGGSRSRASRPVRREGRCRFSGRARRSSPGRTAAPRPSSSAAAA